LNNEKRITTLQAIKNRPAPVLFILAMSLNYMLSGAQEVDGDEDDWTLGD
jgi:hypothetical protein